MAKNTKLDIRQMTIYQVFLRQYSNKQNFEGLIDDLERIKDLGVDIIYLLPIHPIGLKARKGTKGSPYAIKDYDDINLEYGDLEDFETLIKKAHKLGLKVMMDIVINHTSRDSKLTQEHPDWFYHDEKGHFANRVGDWSDITDLDYSNKAVWTYMTDMLMYWAKKVDGFRCDVAPLIPLDFWIQARSNIETIKKDFIWLTESVQPGFIKYLRDKDYECYSDGEMYQAFDICYDYDIFEYMDLYLQDSSKLDFWIDAIKNQEMIYPSNYIKLRSFENHDQKRLRSKVKDQSKFIQMLALEFFLKGTPLIYAGMEHQATHEPSLFEDDLIIWNKQLSVESIISKLAQIKKDDLFKDGHFNIKNFNGVVMISYQRDEHTLYGIFNLENKEEVALPLDDCHVINIFNQKEISIKNKTILLDNEPIIFKITKENTL